MSFSYMLYSESTKVYYFGSTCDLDKRLKSHFYELKRGTHCNPTLQNAWNVGTDVKLLHWYKHGTIEEAQDMELWLISIFIGKESCANIGAGVAGGDNFTYHPKKEEIANKISISMQERYNNLSREEILKIHSQPGEKNGMWGKTHTPETRKFFSQLHKGNQYTKGKKLSESHRKIISEHAKLRTGDKNPFYSKKHSDKTKELLRAQRKGKSMGFGKKISIDGVEYPSYYMAAQATGIPLVTIRWRCLSKNPKYDSYQVCPKCPETNESTQTDRNG